MFWDPKPVLRGGLDIRQISRLQRQAARSSARALAANPETCIHCARLGRLSVIFVVFLESGSADGCVGEECVHEEGACSHKACVVCATMKKKCVRPKPNTTHPGLSDVGPSRSGPTKGSPNKSTTSKANKSRPVLQRAVPSGWRPVMEVTIPTPPPLSGIKCHRSCLSVEVLWDIADVVRHLRSDEHFAELEAHGKLA